MPRFRFKSYEINHLTKNNARTEVLEKWCENGGLDAFDDDRPEHVYDTEPSARSVRPLKLA